MLNIKDEYERARNLSLKMKQGFLVSLKYKDDREIYILGAFTELLKKSRIRFPEYFKKLQPPEPDFHVFTDDRKFYKQIEIVENLHWGRKRGNEDKVPFDKHKYLNDYNRCKIRVWYSFIRNINQKLTKHYGSNSWLLIYHNIEVSHISSNGFWINIIFNMKNEFAKRGLINFSNSTYEKIFVINSGFTELVTIYPKNKVIFSKYAQYSLESN